MSARIDIVNVALTWLGADQITSLDDDSNEARIMKTNYYAAKDATLEAHEWSFAIIRWIPAKDTEAPVWGAANQFPIPANVMRVTQVESNTYGAASSYDSIHSIGRRQQADYRVESGFIITDEDSILCRGIRTIEDEGIYSGLFDHAFAAKLAMMTAYSLTESNSKFQAMASLYAATIAEAKSRDGLQGSNKRIRNRSLQNIR